MKKLFTLFTAMILMGSVINAGTRTIYLDASEWYPSGAAFAIHVWGGASAQSYAFSNVSGDLYSTEIADDATNAIFLRCDASKFDLSNVWNSEWNRSTTTLSAKDLYKVTSWSSGSSDSAEHGEWSTSSGGGDPAPVSNPIVVLKGGFNSWGNADVFTDNGTTATFTRNINAGSYGMKITVDGDWRSNYTTIQRANSGTEYDFSSNPTDATLVADITGDYTFTYTYATQKLSVTFPDNSGSSDPVIHTYTVAGDKTEVFGTAWTPENTANDMIDQGDGTFRFEKTGIELPDGNVNFKVCQDHSWTNCWPAQDYALEIPTSGIYTITITFTESTKAIAAVATKTGDAVVVPTIALHSNITNPDWETSANFVSTDGDITASHTFTNVAAGTYEFGVLKAGSWMSSNSIALTRDNKSVVIENNGDGNATFTADQAGDYTFTWTFAENKLEVTYPDLVTKTIYIQNKTGWANPYLYAWETGVSDANLLGSWHGSAATGTETVGEVEYLTYTLKESAFPCNIIFNNGLDDEESAQLAGYRLETAGNYYLIAEYGILRDKDATPATYHIYVHNFTGWDTFDVYAWGDTEYLGGWPGKEAADDVATVDNSEYLVYNFQAYAGQTVNLNLIFHNNVGENVEGDLRQYGTITEARDYYFTVEYANSWEGKSALKRFRTTELLPIYGYAYNGDGPVGASWPGTVLGLVNGWYEYVIPEGQTVIFNDGADKPTQTADLAYADGDQCLVWKGFSIDDGGKFIMTTTNDCAAPVYTTYERSVTSGNYGTIILPVNAHAVNGATLFSIAGKNDDGIFVDEVEQLVKGTPYIFLASASNLVVEYEDGQQFNSTEDHLYAMGNNGLVGYIGENASDLYTVTPNAHNYILYNNALYYVDSEAKIASNRAFIDWSNVPDNTPEPAPGRKRCAIGVNKVPTALINANADIKAEKRIENGQLYIIKNGVMYNAQGIIVK